MSSNKHPKLHELIISQGQAGLRLDKVLVGVESIKSRSRAAELIARGLVKLGGRPLKASYLVRPQDRIEVEIPEAPASGLQPLNAPLDVLYQDEDLIVVNKPSGLVVHPAAGHAQDTLVNILLHHADRLAMGFAENRPGIVHRLDRDTSGVLVAAKNDGSHHSLARQFREKSVHRIYWAIVSGTPRGGAREGTIRSRLARHPTQRKRFASTTSEGVGKPAITHYKFLQSRSPQGPHWVQCQLETGRTHQIRVHLSEAGLPILGDPIYGGRSSKSLPRLGLHAVELGFEHPRTHERMMFRSGWPQDLRESLIKLGFENV